MIEIKADTIASEDSIDAAFDLFYKNGWTDGLPIIPPTRKRVDAMMSTVDRAPGDCVAQLRPKMGDATIEKLAINAVMAGCLPSYFPVIVAAVEALADPKCNLYSVNTTTNPATQMLIINGPIRNEIDLNCSWGCLGPGWRANATIGRAISLIMLNIAGRIPGEVSKAVIAHPGRYGMCIGEREEESPWEPLHVELGYKAEESTVTIVMPSGTHSLEDIHNTTAEPLLQNLAGGMSLSMTLNTYPHFGQAETLLIMCPDHALILAQGGFNKKDIKQYFFDHIRIPFSFFCQSFLDNMAEVDRGERVMSYDRQKLIEAGLIQKDVTQITENGVRHLARPEQLIIVVAGGDGRLHSAYCPTFGDSYVVTRPIKYKK